MTFLCRKVILYQVGIKNSKLKLAAIHTHTNLYEMIFI